MSLHSRQQEGLLSAHNQPERPPHPSLLPRVPRPVCPPEPPALLRGAAHQRRRPGLGPPAASRPAGARLRPQRPRPQAQPAAERRDLGRRGR